MPAKCVSSVSPRFHCRRLTFCFLPLAAILESPQISFNLTGDRYVYALSLLQDIVLMHEENVSWHRNMLGIEGILLIVFSDDFGHIF
jgi:hypothetical protein